jgi:hypothetical protein
MGEAGNPGVNPMLPRPGKRHSLGRSLAFLKRLLVLYAHDEIAAALGLRRCGDDQAGIAFKLLNPRGEVGRRVLETNRIQNAGFVRQKRRAELRYQFLPDKRGQPVSSLRWARRISPPVRERACAPAGIECGAQSERTTRFRQSKGLENPLRGPDRRRRSPRRSRSRASGAIPATKCCACCRPSCRAIGALSLAGSRHERQYEREQSDPCPQFGATLRQLNRMNCPEFGSGES